MSTPSVEALPPSYKFGYIVGRVLRAIADTAEDVDDKPQARAAAGKVRFTPTETLRKVTEDGSGMGAFVTFAAEEANLSSTGRILDAEGRQGIWLVTGRYTVSFELGVDRVSPFEIEVTEAHTALAPLDLARSAPYTPPAGVTVVTYTLPAGGADGQVLVKSGAADGGAAWAPAPAASGPVDSTKITDATTVGKAVLTAASAIAARDAMGAGTSSLQLGTGPTTAKAGDWKPVLSDLPAGVQTSLGKADTAVQPAGLTKAAVGLGSVDNTSDAAKPVSTAQQTALDAKAADGAVVKLTGAQTVAGVKTFSSAPVVPDASFAIAKTTGLQAALDAKGTSSLALGATSTTAKAGDWKPTVADLPAGSVVKFPQPPNAPNTNANATRPTARTDICVSWRTTVTPVNALDGDEILYVTVP